MPCNECWDGVVGKMVINTTIVKYVQTFMLFGTPE